MTKERQRAWEHFFKTKDKDPLILAYWDSIEYIARNKFPNQTEEMISHGLMGICKAADRLDLTKVKSVDAWVYLNAKGMMLNAVSKKKRIDTVSLDAIMEDDMSLLDVLAAKHNDDDWQLSCDLLDVLSARDAQILECLYYFDMSRREVANMLDLTYTRIYQIEKAALAKLRPLVDE